MTHGSVSGLTVIASKKVSGIIIKNSTHIQFHTNEVYSDENVDTSGSTIVESAIVVFSISLDNVKLKEISMGSYILMKNFVNITNTDIKLCSVDGLVFSGVYNLNTINVTIKDTKFK